MPSRARQAPVPGSSGPALAGLARLLECSADGLVQADHGGMISYLNAAARSQLGLPGDAAGGPLHWHELLDPQAGRRACRSIPAALRRDGRWEGELRLRGAGGHSVPFQILAVAHHDDGASVTHYSALLRSVAGERQAHQQIQRQADILQAITEAIPATVVVVDGKGCYRFANRAFERYCGLGREQIIGRRAIDVLGPDEVARRRPFMARAYQGEAVEFVLDYPGDQGTQWLALSCIPLKVDGVVDGFVGISQDVTREHRERDRLVHLAERDPLTGLLNRGGFERSIENLMFGETPTSVALLYVDLDHFKPVNDTHGHLAGDRLLQMFAQRLLKAVRTSDVVARLGGDEFAVLLPGVPDHGQAVLVADKVLAAARQPFVLDDCTLNVTASVGVALGLQPQAGWRELLGRADTMLYRAKADGRGRAMA
ncbi:MAG: sensor domain-containing diguanylate cyclase [Piscinibacter sp.]